MTYNVFSGTLNLAQSIDFGPLTVWNLNWSLTNEYSLLQSLHLALLSPTFSKKTIQIGFDRASLRIRNNRKKQTHVHTMLRCTL